MLRFIKVNGGYLGFWLGMSVLGLVGMYWAVKWGDALRVLDR